jgi:hypothetical protein
VPLIVGTPLIANNDKLVTSVTEKIEGVQEKKPQSCVDRLKMFVKKTNIS